MIVFLNDRFVPDAEATVSVFDRSFLLGDGLFETVRIVNGRAFRWGAHMDRLEEGAAFLKIRLPYTRSELVNFLAGLVSLNGMPEAILRLTLSRGPGARGYSPAGANTPNLVMALHPAPAAAEGWRVRISGFRLPAADPLARYKTCNKLVQILARAEAESAGADEAVMLNTDGFVIEAASSNLFWVENGTVGTPPLTDGVLPGVTRAVVCELCRRLGIASRETSVRPADLLQMQAAFITQSIHGIIRIREIDGAGIMNSPIVARLREAYAALVRQECA
jgi:aminodeoxychorismate lyase